MLSIRFCEKNGQARRRPAERARRRLQYASAERQGHCRCAAGLLLTKSVVVREYARLTTGSVENRGLHRATVTKIVFDYQCRLAGQFRVSGAQLLKPEGKQWLRLDNFVGILDTPCGTTLEILPKNHDTESSEDASCVLLTRMIQAAFDLPVRQVGSTDITLFRAPLSE